MEGQLVFIRALVYIHLNFDILYICKYLYYSAHAQTQKVLSTRNEFTYYNEEEEEWVL
jgi:hypothetical protein